MDKDKNYSALKKFCLGLGVDLFGAASVAKANDDFLLSAKVKDKLKTAVSLGVRLSRAVLEDIETHPTKIYFHHYRSVNALLDQAALKTTNFIQAKGFNALPIPASQIIDWQKQTAHLSHKKIAVLAGLGWVGRNNLLVNKKLGSQLRLITVLTDMPLKLDKPVKDDCGACRSCVETCPAQAIKETQSEFDHLGCFAKLKEFQKLRLVDQFICGICVNACGGSFNKRSLKNE